MATLEQIEAALRAADAAGNTEDARALAQAYAQAKAAQPQAPKPPQSATNEIAAMIAGKPKPQRRSTYNLTGVPGVSTHVGAFLDGLQHHTMNPLHGAAQLVTHGLEGVGILPDGTAAADDAALRRREADYQARTGDTAGSYVGAAVGELAPWMLALRALRSAGLLPNLSALKDVQGAGAKAANIAAKTGLLAAEGATMGAATPVTGDGDFASQKGAQVVTGAVAAPAIRAGLKGAGAAARGTGRAARYLSPSGRDAIADERLAKLYGSDAAILAQLRGSGAIPGYQHTVAQVLGTPQAVQAERVLRNNGNTAVAFAERESANNLALRDQAARMAGTDAEMQAAQDARRGVGSFWRDNLALGAEDGRFARAGKHLSDFLNSRPMNMTEFKVLDEARKIAGQVQRGTIDALEGERRLAALQPKTRAGQKALEQATGILNQGLVNPGRIIKELELLSRSGNKAVSGAAADHLATIAKNQDSTGWVHARVLDDVRQNIGSMLRQHQGGSAEGAKFGPLQAKITSTIDRAIPGYRDSLAAYARASQPINDMEAGRALLGAIDSGGRDAGGNQAVTLTHLKTLLSKDSRAEYPMSPQAQAKAQAMLEALQKRSITNNTIAASGPGTAADMARGFAASPLGQRSIGGLAGLLGTATGGPVGGIASLLAVEGGTALNNSVMRRVGTKAADAKMAADAIEAHVRRLQRQRALEQQFNMPSYLLPYIER